MSTPTEHHRTWLAALPAIGVAAVLVLGGCSALGNGHSASASSSSNTAGRQSARDRLNDGYSALYSTAQGLAGVDKLLYVKVESDDVQRVVEDVTGYSDQLARRMQKLSRDFPALALDRQSAPAIVLAALQAQEKGTLKRFAPVVGASGKAFERGLLIRLLGGVDQLRYLAETIAQREPDPTLSKIMRNAGIRYASLYDEVDALLKKRFYR